MCYAIPGKVIEMDGESAVIDYGGIRKTINVSLISAAVGDYVLVHAGFAIEKLDTGSAKKVLQEAAEVLKDIE